MPQCKSIGCFSDIPHGENYCSDCLDENFKLPKAEEPIELSSLAAKYPNYYKKVGGMTEIDVYAVHHLFNVLDPSGCIHHSSKKLLLSGVRTGGKSAYKDIKEARDTLTRWLQLNPEHSI